MKKAMLGLGTLAVVLFAVKFVSAGVSTGPVLQSTSTINQVNPALVAASCPVGCKGAKGDPGPAGPAGPAGPMGPASCQGEGCLVDKVYFKSIDVNAFCGPLSTPTSPGQAYAVCYGDKPNPSVSLPSPVARPSCDPFDVQIGGGYNFYTWDMSQNPPVAVEAPGSAHAGEDYSSLISQQLKIIIICADTSSLLGQ